MTNPMPNYELRVLAGPQEGASIALKQDTEVSIGSADATKCQIVLRDPTLQAHRVRLRLMGDRARIKVVEGRVDMAGQVLTGPCHADWPLFTPLKLGATIIAIGEVKSDRWAVALTAATSTELVTTEDTGETQPEPEPVRTGLRPEAWVATIGGAVAVGVAMLLGFVSVTSTAQQGPGFDRERLTQLIELPEFRSLSLDNGKDGTTIVRGELPTRAARAKLETTLLGAGLSPTLDVRVTADMGSAVAEVFRMNGIAATVKPVDNEAGAFHVRTMEGDMTKLANAQRAVQRDVPGLTTMNVSNTKPPKPPSSNVLVHDAQKRIASVVGGAVPYIATVDGGRYFVGAMLPSGHRVESINDQQVLLSKDGVTLPLQF